MDRALCLATTFSSCPYPLAWPFCHKLDTHPYSLTIPPSNPPSKPNTHTHPTFLSSQLPKFYDLVVKCLIKLTKSLQTNMEVGGPGAWVDGVGVGVLFTVLGV